MKSTITALLCAMLLVGEIAQAVPVSYAFFGYVIYRPRLAEQRLPVEFTAGTPIEGQMLFDLDHEGMDPDGNSVIEPIVALQIRSAAGGLIASPTDSGLRFINGIEKLTIEGHALSSGVAPFAGVRFTWSAPGAGQLPQDIHDVNPVVLQPNSWDLKLSSALDPSCPECGEPIDVAYVHIVMFTPSGMSHDTSDNFASPPSGWLNSGGEWFWRDGFWTNAANTAFTGTTYSGRELKSAFSVDSQLLPEWRASGNTFGLLFNYLNSNNFYEVRLNALGTVTLNKVINGTRTMIQSGRYEVPPVRTPLRVLLQKSGSDIAIRVEGGEDQIRVQDTSLSRGRAGAFASWNKLHVEEFGIRQTPHWGTALSHFDTAAGWTPAAGSWIANAGVYRNTSSQAAAISLAATPIFARRYAIHTDFNFQWSAPGNRGGVVYDYVDANNYRAVLIRAVRRVNGSLEGGGIELIEVRNGVRRTIPSTQPAEPGFRGGQWAHLSVMRIGDVTAVRATCRDSDCGELREDFTQTELVGRKRAGLVASWNLVQFDDVVLATEN